MPSPTLEVREAMRARMARADATPRYNRRIATIEPVFSGLESAMGFRRLSTRHAAGVEAEITLKLLAYNLGRLMALVGGAGVGPGLRLWAFVRVPGELLGASPTLGDTTLVPRVYLDAA